MNPSGRRAIIEHMFGDPRGTDATGLGHQVIYRPGRPVWLDLSKVYPVTPTGEELPDGMDLQSTVPGVMKMRDRTTTGHWIGWVTYTTGQPGNGAIPHGQWVLGDAITERTEPDPPRGVTWAG